MGDSTVSRHYGEGYDRVGVEELIYDSIIRIKAARQIKKYNMSKAK